MNIKKFLKVNGKNFILCVVGAILALVAMIFAAFVTANDGSVDATIIILSCIAIVGGIVTGVLDYENLGKSIVAGLYFCCFGLFVCSQLGNLGYALAGIHDIGNGLQPGFIVGSLLYLVSTVLAAFAVFGKNNKQ